MYRKKVSQKRLYDVTSDIYSQVYGGKSAERFRTNIGTKRTTGEVLMYNDENGDFESHFPEWTPPTIESLPKFSDR